MRLHCQLVLASLRLELGEMQEALCESVFGVRIVPGTSGHVNANALMSSYRTGRESNVALWPPQVPPLLEEVFYSEVAFASHHLLQAFQLLQDAELCMTRPGLLLPVQWPQLQRRKEISQA